MNTGEQGRWGMQMLLNSYLSYPSTRFYFSSERERGPCATIFFTRIVSDANKDVTFSELSTKKVLYEPNVKVVC